MMLNDSTTSYMINVLPYLGLSDEERENIQKEIERKGKKKKKLEEKKKKRR